MSFRAMREGTGDVGGARLLQIEAGKGSGTCTKLVCWACAGGFRSSFIGVVSVWRHLSLSLDLGVDMVNVLGGLMFGNRWVAVMC